MIRQLVRVAVVLAAVGLVVPAPTVHPVTISLTDVESAKRVDFDGGTAWLLVLGSDARPGVDVTRGNTDAIQLVGLDLESGRAVGIGIPRDAWVDVAGESARINTAYGDIGPDGLADIVADLVGIQPDYVLLAGFDGFRDMVDAIGGVDVRVDEEFVDPASGLQVRPGLNSFDAQEALDFTRTRKQFGSGDFARSANQQLLMLGLLRGLLAHEDEPGFLERGTLAALRGFDTDLSPQEVYRLAQAVTRVRPGQVTTCVLPGTPDETAVGASIVLVDAPAARRIGADAADDFRLRGC
ncbi:LytR family transcriptional regulator [Nocardioides sp. MAH-18]|uniref:LytR family transcriptional regulator n=1 Tax=Nocardioides agri TaxID=2682843 RepID=A0A6L6XQI5_9ACTN|nr:LCP family protein [Nocardioides sp. CGMCC 1.13656]MBA2954766.1 LCP family protein [Nocardioides sp. CGMCC 1.13656]MVQ49621.1 LytR family transcriptional regulator [Nocardioides sp. MAH-18]